MKFKKELDELRRRKEKVLKMGGEETIRRRHEKGMLTARERVGGLLDKGSFLEIGMLNSSDVPGMEEKTPADSKIAGFGKIGGRQVIVVANDFTVLAATSSRVASRKEGELRAFSDKKGLPLIYLGESGGARMPDIMGAKGLGSIGGGEFDTFIRHMSRIRKSPMIVGVMGKCYGMPTWMACLADFVVQVKGSAMGVSGPRVLELALSEKISDEELGGWEVHAGTTGMVDRVAEGDDDCFRIIKEFLSYMPSHCGELSGFQDVPEGSGSYMAQVLKYLPEKRNRAYDMNLILRCLVDRDSLFPVKPDFGSMVITALARMGGRAVGIIANQPMYNAGAMNTDGIDKVISFLCLCDSFNIPLIFLHDTPGFIVGKEAERRRVAARVMNFINALAQVTVPKISIIIRKSYGMAFYSMCGSGCGADFLAAWPTAEMSFIDPEIGANVVFGGKGLKSERDKHEWEDMVQKMVEDAAPYAAAGMHYIHDVIEPAETRNYIINTIGICRDSRTGGISEHKLANWPTKF